MILLIMNKKIIEYVDIVKYFEVNHITALIFLRIRDKYLLYFNKHPIKETIILKYDDSFKIKDLSTHPNIILFGKYPVYCFDWYTKRQLQLKDLGFNLNLITVLENKIKEIIIREKVK